MIVATDSRQLKKKLSDSPNSHSSKKGIVEFKIRRFKGLFGATC